MDLVRVAFHSNAPVMTRFSLAVHDVPSVLLRAVQRDVTETQTYWAKQETETIEQTDVGRNTILSSEMTTAE